MRIVLHPEAEREFTAAALYYERERPGLGADFLAEFDAAMLDPIFSIMDFGFSIVEGGRRRPWRDN